MKSLLFSVIVAFVLLASCQESPVVSNNDSYYKPLNGTLSNTNITKEINGGGKCTLQLRTSEYFIEQFPGEGPNYEMVIKMDILSDKKIYYATKLRNDIDPGYPRKNPCVVITAYGPSDTTYQRLHWLGENAASMLQTWPLSSDSALAEQTDGSFTNNGTFAFESRKIGTNGELEFKIYFKSSLDKDAPIDSLVSRIYYNFKL